MYLSTEEYADAYLKLMKDANSNGHNVNVSTITLLCELNSDKIDIKAFTEVFDEPDVGIKISKNNKQFELTKRGKMKKTFFNQVTLNYVDVSKKSIKIFSNGKLQITGVSSCFECHHVIGLVTKWLNSYKPVDSPVFDVKHAYMGMLNVNFSVGRHLDLKLLNRILNQNDHVMSVYNPETYPAINMKLCLAPGEFACSTKDRKNISIFVFGTGNIVVTGGKDLPSVHRAYMFIVEQLNSNASVFLHKKQPNAVKSNIPSYCGYTIKQYMSCVKKYDCL
jgi:TATA-box binding protein (TBP) (component of TFIID and TFIIIB)